MKSMPNPLFLSEVLALVAKYCSPKEAIVPSLVAMHDGHSQLVTQNDPLEGPELPPPHTDSRILAIS